MENGTGRFLAFYGKCLYKRLLSSGKSTDTSNENYLSQRSVLYGNEAGGSLITVNRLRQTASGGPRVALDALFYYTKWQQEFCTMAMRHSLYLKRTHFDVAGTT